MWDNETLKQLEQDRIKVADLESKVAMAISAGTVLPDFPEGIDLDAAYEMQHRVTKLRSPNGVAGVKAGVTAQNVQAFFGLEHALIASLYDGTQLESGSELPLVEGRLIETEVALKIDAEGNPISIAPALEVVAVRFSDPKQMSGSNLVVCNLGADLFVVGEFQPWDSRFNDLAVTLRHGNNVINDTQLSDALGGPEAGASWVLGEAKQRGFAIGNDTVYMMGACGKAVPAEPGAYVGDYGELGRIELTISEKVNV